MPLISALRLRHEDLELKGSLDYIVDAAPAILSFHKPSCGPRLLNTGR